MKNGKRMSFKFQKGAVDRLERLKTYSESDSYTDVIRSSLRLYEWMIKQRNADHEVMIKDKDGNLTKVEIFSTV